ncbi:hypothetical protein [Polyangium aurulentum]|uniref:hypothetical protein n=1 Tax=Polyangium aurulentum TaxID=2567896 RepID=UPI0010ADF638|nr:hypothetical protein [Polyangium aurulentum]UQA60496.1 hypothetical protein E8A73_008500 [Polyangium aurulentum]
MRRAVLFALFAFTLPFVWGNTSSCNGPQKAYTGFELFTSEHNNGIHAGLMILAPVLLGLLQRYVRNALVRLALELPAIVCGLWGALYCYFQAVFGDGILSNERNVHPAPFIAAFAPFLMAVDACRGAAERITELLAERRRRRAVAAAKDEVQPPTGV